MVKINWTMRAADDLQEIAEYIALDKPDAAADFVAKLLKSVEQLAEFPFKGRIVPELQSARYREVIFTPCRIIYTPEGDSVIIQRIIRGEQKMRQGLLPP